MPHLTFGSLENVVKRSTNEGAGDLPGITLESYVVHNVQEFNRWSAGEIYMFGVAVDATGEVKAVPVGQAELDKKEGVFSLERVHEKQTIRYLGSGLPLVLPPAQKFLALRLLIAESDAKARDAVDVIQSVGDAVGSKEAALLLTTTGLPEAAAIAVVLGKVLDAASKLMARNKDDVVETFSGYFTPADMHPGARLPVDKEGASAVFRFVE